MAGEAAAQNAENQEQNQEQNQETAKVDYTALAKQQGWKSLEELDDKSKFVDAEEFVKRKPFFDTIKSQSREIRTLIKKMDALSGYHSKAIEAAVNKAISDLKLQKKEAIEAGDVGKVEKIDNAIKTQEKALEETTSKSDRDVDPAISTWLEKNPWYEDDDELKDFAISYNDSYIKRHKNTTTEEALKKTTEAVKKAFPEKFKDKAEPAKNVAQSVEGSAPADRGGKKKFSRGDLNEEQKLVYDQMVTRNKVMTADEYFTSLVEIGELK